MSFETAMTDMHDWTLESVHFDWPSAVAELRLVSPLGPATIAAEGVHDLKIPRSMPWGPSRSVNVTDGPTPMGGSLQSLRIEMQSGDVIEIVARTFALP